MRLLRFYMMEEVDVFEDVVVDAGRWSLFALGALASRLQRSQLNPR